MLTPLTPADLPAFTAMVVSLYGEDPGPVSMTPERARAQAERLLARPNGATAYLLEIAGEPVGYCILVPFWSNEFGGEMVYLDELWIAPARRGRGLGRAAVDAVVRHAAAEGFKRVALEVNDDNAAARRLYERAGFGVESRRTLAMQLRTP
ncbi:MAG: GNAT family N-acetyltransferase [Myxococcota bacterium]